MSERVRERRGRSSSSTCWTARRRCGASGRRSAGTARDGARALEAALGRVLAEDVVAEVDVPAFDRSGVDGFAVRAADLDGAGAERPACCGSTREIACGVEPRHPVGPGTAT